MSVRKFIRKLFRLDTPAKARKQIINAKITAIKRAAGLAK